MNYKDYNFFAEKGSLKTDEEVLLDLKSSLVGPPSSNDE
jgi:hypothetical protein